MMCKLQRFERGCEKLGYRNPREVEDVIIHEAAQQEYHPVKRYLHSVMWGWDGGAHISQLATYFAEDDMPQPILSAFATPLANRCCCKGNGVASRMPCWYL